MQLVLDTYSFFAFLEKEDGSDIVRIIFQKALKNKQNLLLSTINWGEIYYISFRKYGKHKAEKIMMIIDSFPVELIATDMSIIKEAAKIKATHPLSYADAFAAAVSKIYHATLLTGDLEFKSLEKEIKIKWIR